MMTAQPEIKKYSTRQILELSILILLLLLYTPLILHWVDGWLHENISTVHEYFSHGIITLPFAGYVIWFNRKKWHRLPDTTHPLGGFLLLLGGVFYLSGVAEWVDLSFPVILVGICLWFKGIGGLKLQRFPMLLVSLATPTAFPYIVAPYTFPWQSFIAHTVGFILSEFGMKVTVLGIDIYVNNQITEIAPYCAGLKLLLSSINVSLILLYWTNTISSRQITTYFLGTTACVSIVSNIVRNTLLAYLHGIGQAAAFEWLHAGWGGEVYSTCTLLVLIPALNWISSYFSSDNLADGINEN